MILYTTGNSIKTSMTETMIFTEKIEVEQRDKLNVLAQFRKRRTIWILMRRSTSRSFRIESSFTTMK